MKRRKLILATATLAALGGALWGTARWTPPHRVSS
jgi:hypothetical protein